MKQLIFVWLLLCLGTAAHAQSYSFAVKTYGTGTQALVFIPGFACSGEVWQETVNALQDRYTCYVLTMPGFAGVLLRLKGGRNKSSISSVTGSSASLTSWGTAWAEDWH